MSGFAYYTLEEHDGTEECNRIKIEDEQCTLCLDDIVRDYYVTKSFKIHQNGRSICLECSNESAIKLQELVKERIGWCDTPPINDKSFKEFLKLLKKQFQSLVEESEK